jgi:Flp pilus assembly protein TadD
MCRRFVLALLVVCLSAVGVLAQQSSEGNIVGQLRIARGNQQPARIEVKLTTRGATLNTVYTDNEGKFAFYHLEPNVYHVIIEDENYDRREETVAVNPTVQRTNIVMITITPKPNAKQESEPGPVGGSNPFVVDLSEYKKNYPKKVIKEFEAGLKAQEAAKLDDAVRHFEAALALSSDFYPAHNNLGAIYVEEGKFAAAREEFETVLRLNQGDVQAYFNLGNVFLLTGEYAKAQQVVEQGLRRQPTVSFGHFLLGSALIHTGKPREAELELRKAQELDPLNSKVHLELVNLYVQQHRSADAIQELKLFLERFPTDPLAPKARDVLAKLEGTPAAPK